jgi:signal transduction histidine kinase
MAMRYCSRQGVMAAGALTLANCCLGTWAVLADRLQGTIFNGWWIRFGVYLLELSPASGATGAASKLVLLGLFWLPSLAVMALALAWRWRASLTAKNAAAGQAFAQRERQLIAAAAEEAERGRISREMHDIVAHSLSVIIAQADGGRYAAANNPEAAVTALAAISETGRAALADMRGIVRGLREGPPEADPARLEPVPHARDIDELIETVRAAGLDASMVRMGTPRDLPPGMGLTIHRIVQEALTNAMKHAGPGARVTVLERWDPTAITLTVTDDGRGAAASGDGQGHGVLGMRERTEMLGGVFMAGPSPTGGFQVRATIPLPSAPVTQ